MPITKDNLITEVAESFDNYQPNVEVTKQLGRIDLTIVTAPTGIGKNTLMNATGLFRVLPETIRAPRMNDGVMEQNGIEYEFRGAQLDAVHDDYLAANYVQIGMGPGRKSFYATRAANYPEDGAAVMDLMVSQVDYMRSLPFKSLEAVHITVPSYEEWLKRVMARGIFTAEEWTARKVETAESVSAALEDDRFTFIANDDAPVASGELKSVAMRADQSAVNQKINRRLAINFFNELSKG